MRTSVALLALAAAAVSAQQKYASSLDMKVDPNTVKPADRASWCTAQTNTCFTLCDDDAPTNDCDFTLMTYDCKCGGNSSAPGLQYYTQTMPTFICQTHMSQCIEQNVGSQNGQKACKKDIGDLCATANPPTPGDNDDTEDEEPTETDSAATTGADKPSATGDSAASTTTSDSLGATAAPQAMGALAALGLVAAFF